MSTEFFTTIEEIQKIANEIKFLDGSHPAIGDKYEKKIIAIKTSLEKIDKSLKRDLKKFYKP